MKSARWKEVEKLYNAAMDIEPARRTAFLDKACAGDKSLRAEVESLLAHGERAGSFIEAPAIEMVAREIASDGSPSKEEQIIHPAADEVITQRNRAPWWMYAIIAAFLVCTATSYYAFFVEFSKGEIPEPLWPAMKPAFDNKGAPIGGSLTVVVPNSIYARAGMQTGDIVGATLVDFLRQRRWEAGRSYPIEIIRNGESKTVFIIPRPAILAKWSPWEWSRYVLFLASPLFLILAVMVVLRQPDDWTARWGSLSMGIWAIMIAFHINPSYALNEVLLKLPRILGLSQMFFSLICGALLLSAGVTFFAVFPRRLFQRRWIWALIWLPAAMNLPLFILSSHPPIYSFPRWWPEWFSSFCQYLAVLTVPAIVGVAILGYFRLRDINERRRARFFAIGILAFLIGFSQPLLRMTGILPAPVFRRMMEAIPQAVFLLLGIIGCGSPIFMAYAIIRYRLFDIRVMVRLGLRYAAAKGMLLSLVPIFAAVLAGDLLLHQNQPLGQILAQRGVLYSVLGGSGFLLHMRRRFWLDSIDRRFFRERYDAQRVLRSVIEEIRESRNFEKAAPHVVSQIEAALHPEFAALLARKPGDSKYRVLAARETAPPAIPADSKLMALVRLLGKPLEISQSQTSWLRSQLPQQESEFLRRARMEWLFPICLAEGQTEALLAVGPKRSEEPYSREDQELLQGITSSLALLLEQSPPLAPLADGFEECPKCGTCYDTGAGSCKKEGAKLVYLSFPRFLDHRYRFEQRLGEGGMGMVYQAFDTELERQVAVKLIRSDMTASADAAARFKQEAKAAASFTHPNVVTVYDFGLAEDQRAYLVMELLRGVTLRQELQSSGRLPSARALEVLRGVCTAADAAHHQSLIHRDLKPENIFLVKAGNSETAKILDFGVVKPIAPTDTTLSIGQTGPGMLVGTLKYMSPEQLRGKKPTESWDVWALAVVAYEMLAGVHPFGGNTVLELHHAILSGRAMPLHAHLPEAPQSWQRFFDKALSSNSELRPNSAIRLFSDFKQHIE
jgi:eukaryotic-like serine/threonine-protein kinase